MKRMKRMKRIDEFDKGIVWNYFAILLMALNGFVCNFIIAFFYDALAVGLYNRIYSYYLVLSQISVFGIHMSIAQSIPKLGDNINEQRNSFVSAIICTLFASCITVFMMLIIILSFKKYIGYSTITAMKNIGGALILFSINKVILALFNGLSMMKEHAILQSARYALLGGSVLILSLFSVRVTDLTYCFCIAEAVVLVGSIVLLMHHKFLRGKINKNYIIEHISFGRKILLSNVVLDLNTKVDIIFLGFLLKNDYYVGIYSFAVMFVEGYYQVLAVIRKSINPKITQCYWEILKDSSILKKAEKITKWTSASTYIGIIVGYVLICLIMGKREYLQGLLQILVIGFSIFITSKYILYGNMFSQIGKPQIETRINVITVLTNMSLNLLLIPNLKNNGAAIATSFSYIVFAVVFNIYKRKDSKLCIFFNN